VLDKRLSVIWTQRRALATHAISTVRIIMTASPPSSTPHSRRSRISQDSPLSAGKSAWTPALSSSALGAP
jgi:hypothetical protein